MIWSLAQMRGTRLGEVTRKPGSFERDISPKREVLSSERWTLSPRREWLAQASSQSVLMIVLSNTRLGDVCVLF